MSRRIGRKKRSEQDLQRYAKYYDINPNISQRALTTVFGIGHQMAHLAVVTYSKRYRDIEKPRYLNEGLGRQRLKYSKRKEVYKTEGAAKIAIGVRRRTEPGTYNIHPCDGGYYIEFKARSEQNET